jgi:hypothetical protein
MVPTFYLPCDLKHLLCRKQIWHIVRSWQLPENCTCSLLGMLQPGSTPAPQPPSRNVPAGLNTCTSLFFTLRFSPGRQPSACRTGELYLLAAGDAAAGLDSCAAASCEECSGRAQHLHLTLLHTEILSESPAFRRLHWRHVSCSWLGMLLPGSTPALQPPARNVPAGLNTYTSLFFKLRSSPNHRPSAGHTGQSFLD